MGFFYKHLAQLYCDLVSIGIKFKPPGWLFNKPKQTFSLQYQAEFLADSSFTSEERKHILNGIKDFESFCNGMIKFSVSFELEPTSLIDNDASLILKIDSKHSVTAAADGYYQSNIIGLYQPTDRGVKLIYLIHDRLKDPVTYRTTVTHELGHYCGMQHLDYPSIMHKSNFGNVLFPTYYDAVEFAKIFQCNVEDLKYFKL